MKPYLICSKDESVTSWPPYKVMASTAEEAISSYLKVVISKAEVFRESVLDLTVNMSFVERFYIASRAEQARFHKTGTVGTEEEIVKSRVNTFFAARPDLGERYSRYMDTEDQSLICEEMFQFIAVYDKGNRDEFVALDLDLIPFITE